MGPHWTRFAVASRYWADSLPLSSPICKIEKLTDR